MNSLDTISEFDTFADIYDSALNQGLSLAGETKAHFAAGRMHWLGRRLAQLEIDPESVLDFGCGTGSATPYFFAALGVKRVLGVDASARSIEVAERMYGSTRVSFQLASAFAPKGDFDLAFSNGVFHHILPAERAACLKQIHAALRPGALFALWENNPWNPGTRFVMRRIPFDGDAVMVWPHGTRKMLRTAGFEILRTDFLFIFPAFLKWLRWLEPRFCRVALGGQYMVLARKPN
jgi:SAM-dependent methyltransferase